MASTASPLGLPPLSHSAMVTRGVLRMRLTFQDFSWVIDDQAVAVGRGPDRPSASAGRPW